MATANELHEARRYYATQWGDGFSSPDWMGADDLIAEGWGMADQAAHMAEDDRDWFLSGKLARRSEDETHLIAVAFYAAIAEGIAAAKANADGYSFRADYAEGSV